MKQRDIHTTTINEFNATNAIQWMQLALSALRRDSKNTARRRILYALQNTRQIVRREREAEQS